MIRRVVIATCILTAMVIAPSPADAGPGLMLSGSDTAVWLVRVNDDSNSFDIAVRQKDRAWEWIGRGLSGKPARIMAGGHRLHVLFAPRLEHLIFDNQGRALPAVTPNDPNWPDDVAPAAMAQWQDPNTGEPAGLIAVVPRPTDSELATMPTTTSPPSTAPATMPEASTAPGARTNPSRNGFRGLRKLTLGIFARSEGRWRQLTDLPNVIVGDSGKFFVASRAGRVFVMVADEGRSPNRLHQWSEGKWRQVPLTGPAAEEAPLALLSVSGQLVVVMAGPADTEGKRELTLAALDPNASKIAAQKMLLRGKPATFTVGALPQVSRLADQLVLLWRRGDDLAFGTCQPRSGELVAKGEPVDVFDSAPGDGAAEEVLANFVWIVLIAVLLLTVLFRQPGAVAPFVLPPGVRPGNILKRLVAMVLDILPCYFAVAAVSSLLIGEQRAKELYEQTMQAWRALPDVESVEISMEWVAAGIAFLLTFMLYGLLMEYRFGATPGKMLMRLRVVGNGAGRPSFRQCLIRNLMKMVELSPHVLLLMLMVVPLVVLITRYNQRVGDLFARTAVIDATPIPIEPAGADTPVEPTQPTPKDDEPKHDE